jgi:processive 1,2-diacylglycerol beta-glucosyltransferase
VSAPAPATRILILYASVGMGHRAAAEALAKAFAILRVEHVRCEDTLDFASAVFRQVYAGSYAELSEKTPAVWRYLYGLTDRNESELSRYLRSLIGRIGVTDLMQMVRAYRPDAVLCTHFLPLNLLARERRRGQFATPLYCVVTDYIGHAYWVEPQADGYFVASPETARALLERGVVGARISVTGIPVDPAIARPKDGARMRRVHRLERSPVVMLMGGGMAADRAEHIVRGLVRRGLAGTLVILAGRNARLEAGLSQIEGTPALSIRGLGAVEYVDDLVAASDLIVTKAGGLIVSEIMARHIPMIVVEPIPGQEEWNADYVVGVGAGIQLRNADMVPLAVETLLGSRARLAALRAAAQRAGRPDAALRVAEAVLAAEASR